MTKNKEHTGYTLEELIHNQEFIDTVTKFDSEEEWNNFININVENKTNLLQAKKFISLFEEEQLELTKEKRHELWLRIKQSEELQKVRRHKFILRRNISIAASLLLIISIGSVLYSYFGSYKTPEYIFTETTTSDKQDNTTLKLANGELIRIQKDESQISVLDSKNVVRIDNDTIYEIGLDVSDKRDKISMNELIVPYGKKATLTLSDGTRVWLNAGSKLAFPQEFSGTNRQVFLDGEGYFEVAENKEKPFIVSSNSMNIGVLGTKFNVSSYDSDNKSETVLLEGSIELWCSKNKLFKNRIKISPNQKATLGSADGEISVDKISNAQDYVAWINGWYKFSNESIDQVFTKIGRFYNVSFSYDRNSIDSALPISGKLDLKESIDEVMYTLSQVAEIESRIEDNTIIIIN